MTAEAQFSVTLHHLAVDLRKAGPEFPDTPARMIAARELRELVEALTALASSTTYPAEPELRIVGPHGRFLVQARNGEMRVSSWSAQAGGANLSPEQILAMILGLEEAEALPARVGGAKGARRARGSARWKLVVLAIAIVGSNGVTAWMLTRPPPRVPVALLPEYQLVAPERAQRVLADFAGEYDTGLGEGDRHLSLRADGHARWFVWGADRAVRDEVTLAIQAAESRGRPALLADGLALIEMKDPITLVYFGDTYRRKGP